MDKPGTGEIAWHHLPEDEVLRRLESSEQGLSEEEARRRLEALGENVLEAEEDVHPFRLLIKQVNNPLIYLLLAAAAMSAAVAHWIDALVILFVVILNSLLGFFQEWRAERALDAISRMVAPKARVLRDGRASDVPAAQIVPGDLLILDAGARVPADARIIKSAEFAVNESLLTGESEPVGKEVGICDESCAMADRTNMTWMSTVVTGGRAVVVVVTTGMNTSMGMIAREVRETKREKTPLQQRMARLAGLIGVAGLLLAAGLFVLGLLRGYELIEMMLFGVAAAVSAIPEGLPAVISITLAMGVQRMARKNAVVRRLPAVETLGSTSVICTDKTGTITKNEMTVTRMWAEGREYGVTGLGYHPDGAVEGGDGELGNGVKLLMTIGCTANDAGLRQKDSRWGIEGDPTEGALLVVAKKAGIEPGRTREDYSRKAEIPFSSQHKYMAVLVKPPEGAAVAHVKGAPERILGFCSHVLDGGARVPLDDSWREKIEHANGAMAEQALRVVAGAYVELQDGATKLGRESVERGLTFVGLWGMLDPPRPEAIEAIAAAHEAGIEVVMLTGDHATTAAAIARQVGISRKGVARATTGLEVEKMSQEEIVRRAKETGVFARVSPGHKLRILEAFKSQKYVVAMTGDGVNDAPALKGADIGVAMGRAGTEVAKEAADMVLMDDNFATIVHAVEQGRIIFSNLRRAVVFLVTTNLGEILTLAATLLIGLPLPVSAVMILWINLVTDGFCTIPLGIEPGHAGVLKQAPRPVSVGILNRASVRRVVMLAPVMAAGTLALFVYELDAGSYPHAQTMAFVTLSAFQWFQAFNARTSSQSLFSVGVLTNRPLLLSIGIAVLLQVGAVHTGVGRAAFGTVPLSGFDWFLCVIAASSILLIDEAFKALKVYERK